MLRKPRSAHGRLRLVPFVLALLLAALPDRWAQAGDDDALQAEVRALERQRSSAPGNAQTRSDLAEAYYRVARAALEAGAQEEFLSYLRKAQVEVIEAVRIAPTDPIPHTLMGNIAAYQGDLDAAKLSLENALRLSQRENVREHLGPVEGLYYSNIAHICVYQGDLDEARDYLEKARHRQAPAEELARIMVLASWKANDMQEARNVFDNALITSKAFAETWDGVRLTRPIKSFLDFTETCCKNPTCGPYLESACLRAQQDIARREIDRETLLRQMQLERERRTALKEIYEQRKDVQISVQDPNAAVELRGLKTPVAPGEEPAPEPPAQP